MARWKEGFIDVWVSRWMDRLMDGKMDESIAIVLNVLISIYTIFIFSIKIYHEYS